MSCKWAHDEEEDPNALPNSKEYPSYGCIYSRQDDPFTNIDNIVNFGIKHEILEESLDDFEEPPALSIKDKQLLHSWELLCSIIPDFHRQMLALSDHRKINHGVATVRADDTSSLKAWIPSYILPNSKDALHPPMAMRNKLKNDRGFYHPVTASLLCPLKYPDTPEFADRTYADIKSGKLPLKAKLLPQFLYPHGHVYNSEDILKDLLCGHVMYRAVKHIFQGPSSALEEPGAHCGKQGNAAICGITLLSPHMIAYVAIQVQFALSSATSWTPKDGTFSYIDFYWYIVGLLDEEDDLESQEIIRLFNYHIFGSKSDAHGNTATNGTEVENEFELVKKQ